jgi:predicted porin
MKKQLVAAAVAATLAIPAMANVDIYGRAHVTLDHLDDGNDSGLNLSSNSSRLGFRANHEIAEGLTGMVQIEQEVRFENGAGNFATRDSFVGLRGDFGMIRLGQFDTPLKIVRGRTDFFGDQIGDARNLTRVRDNYTGNDYDFDTRFRNGVHYRTPTFSNMFVDVHYSTNTDSGSNVDGDNDAISTAFTYQTSSLYLAAAYERKNDTKSDAIRLGAGVSLGDLRINALLQRATVKDANDALTGVAFGSDQDIDVFGIGASYKVASNTTVKGQVYVASGDSDDRDATMVALGVDHSLSRNYRLLFAVARTDNDDNVRYAMSKGGHGAQVTPAAGEAGFGVSVGMRYDF